MCMLDCLLVSAICFYMYKAKNMNGRRNIFTDRRTNGSSIWGVGDTFLALRTIFNKILQLVVKINIFKKNQ